MEKPEPHLARVSGAWDRVISRQNDERKENGKDAQRECKIILATSEDGFVW
jgi:hypothetical protein